MGLSLALSRAHSFCFFLSCSLSLLLSLSRALLLLRVEFYLRTDGRYPKDVEVTFFLSPALSRRSFSFSHIFCQSLSAHVRSVFPGFVIFKSIPSSSVRFCLKPRNSNSYGFELHRPSIKGTKLLLKVLKALIIIGEALIITGILV